MLIVDKKVTENCINFLSSKNLCFVIAKFDSADLTVLQPTLEFSFFFFVKKDSLLNVKSKESQLLEREGVLNWLLQSFLRLFQWQEIETSGHLRKDVLILKTNRASPNSKSRAIKIPTEPQTLELRPRKLLNAKSNNSKKILALDLPETQTLVFIG